jgi:hypothetical protein
MLEMDKQFKNDTFKTKTVGNFVPNGLSGWADSNRRPPRPKRGALPAALHPERREYNGNGCARQAVEYDIIFPVENA